MCSWDPKDAELNGQVRVATDKLYNDVIPKMAAKMDRCISTSSFLTVTAVRHYCSFSPLSFLLL